MKRTPIRRRSPKYAAQNRRAERERERYLREHPLCELCVYAKHVGTVPPRQVRVATDVHHLCGRNAKAWKFVDGEWRNKYEHRKNWQSICSQHHRHVTDDSTGTAGLCAAAKQFSDPENFDLVWLKLTRPTRFANVTLTGE